MLIIYPFRVIRKTTNKLILPIIYKTPGNTDNCIEDSSYHLDGDNKLNKTEVLNRVHYKIDDDSLRNESPSENRVTVRCVISYKIQGSISTFKTTKA